MARRMGLRRRITLWLVGYAALLSLTVFVHGYIVNDQAEQLTWRSLLSSELDHFLARSALDPDYRWIDTSTVSLYGDEGGQPLPPAVAALPPGLHDDVPLDGRDKVVLVQQVRGRRLALALDITELQRHEDNLAVWMLLSNVVAVLLLGALVAWGLGRVVKPLSDMAERIGRLRPDRPGQRIEVDARASAEQVVIADALNDYLLRNDLFVERERAFIDSASHELRTPVAVIGGAAELALEQADTPPSTRNQLLRIRRTAAGVEQLISLLLVLAKDPARLARGSDLVRLDQLLPDIVEDHRHLCADKRLELALAPLPACQVLAPVAIVQAAIGNLLRNAIENSDQGRIHVAMPAPGVVRIDDPGHGMSPEEISAVYARMARGGSREGSGIGLDLIARLCEHLGWALQLESIAGQGTRATLDLSSALKEGGAV
ncbi:HAMP domain-containing histidine kinase [Xanthomonas sp. AmX2]|uniref:sensor histidine kinase n=1 Tax=Xanthomonas sp. TaxID=29446 RepID=UPI001981604B|nr:HAMP domain-containing sensor histidine kinase [Xanthomonas sp.]MBN6149409.1 HAMP domain-containing histidine kinase [Xanthomonas sp.]